MGQGKDLDVLVAGDTGLVESLQDFPFEVKGLVPHFDSNSEVLWPDHAKYDFALLFTQSPSNVPVLERTIPYLSLSYGEIGFFRRPCAFRSIVSREDEGPVVELDLVRDRDLLVSASLQAFFGAYSRERLRLFREARWFFLQTLPSEAQNMSVFQAQNWIAPYADEVQRNIASLEDQLRVGLEKNAGLIEGPAPIAFMSLKLRDLRKKRQQIEDLKPFAFVFEETVRNFYETQQP